MKYLKKTQILFLFFFLFSCQKKEIELSISEIKKQIEVDFNEVAMCIVGIENGNQYQNGIIISSRGHVVTTQHGFKRKKGLKIRGYNSTEYQAKIVKEYPSLDLLLLKIDSEKVMKYAKMTSKRSDVDEIFVIARKQNGELYYKPGKSIMNCLNLSDDMLGLNSKIGIPKLYNNAVLHTSSLTKGFSGSMLVNDKGDMIGMNHGFFETEYMKINLASTNFAKMNEVNLLHGKINRSWYQSIFSVEKQRLRWLLMGFKKQFQEWNAFDEYNELNDTIEIVYDEQGYQKTIKWIWSEFYLLKQKNRI
jgi:hypothetical protein